MPEIVQILFHRTKADLIYKIRKKSMLLKVHVLVIMVDLFTFSEMASHIVCTALPAIRGKHGDIAVWTLISLE